MKVDILGVQINTESKNKLLEQIQFRLDNNRSTFIVTPYSESVVAAQKDEEFRKVLNAADFALPDGAGVVWAAKFLTSPPAYAEASAGRQPSPTRLPDGQVSERVPGREFIWDLAALAESRGESIFLLGGFDDTPAIVAEKLKKKFPNLKISGVSNYPPPQAWGGDGGEVEPRLREKDKIIDEINTSNTDFLFVALGPVAQEKWIYQNLPNLRVKLAIGLGGTFDYVAGKKPLPPQFLSRSGLEWLWRLVTQPWRAWRITKGVLGLIWYTVKAKLM